MAQHRAPCKLSWLLCPSPPASHQASPTPSPENFSLSLSFSLLPSFVEIIATPNSPNHFHQRRRCLHTAGVEASTRVVQLQCCTWVLPSHPEDLGFPPALAHLPPGPSGLPALPQHVTCHLPSDEPWESAARSGTAVSICTPPLALGAGPSAARVPPVKLQAVDVN